MWAYTLSNTTNKVKWNSKRSPDISFKENKSIQVLSVIRTEKVWLNLILK